jgi:hypothetical protein
MPAGAVDAAEAIELDLALVGSAAGPTAVKEAVDELRFGRVVLTPVQPDVEPSRLVRIVFIRQRHTVGENRAVNFGRVRKDLPFSLIPLWLIGLKLFAALDALIKGAECMFDRGLRAEHIRVLKEHLAGVLVDLDIAHQIQLRVVRFEVFDKGSDLFGLFFDFCQFFWFGLDRRLSCSAAPLTTTSWGGLRGGCCWRSELLSEGRLKRKW